MRKPLLVVCALIAACLLSALWWKYLHIDGYQFLPASTLGAMPDDQFMKRCYVELLLRTRVQMSDSAIWKQFKAPAKHILALGSVEMQAGTFGIKESGPEQKADIYPTLKDASDACAAMGLSDAVKVLTEVRSRIGAAPHRVEAASITPTTPVASAQAPPPIVDPEAATWQALNHRFLDAISSPKNMAIRVAYARDHLADIANPR